ncbi:MAG: NAD(P)H-dependent oxidoreductase [Pseudomonadota bacterium]
MSHTILKINASPRLDGASRPLVERAVTRLSAPNTMVIDRDLSNGLPFVDAPWLAANWSDPATRSAEAKAQLALSDELIGELRAADTVVLGVPMWNFGVPAVLKAWIDLVVRNGQTFEYTANGPRGLLSGKSAVVVIATGGVPLGAPVDHTSGHVRTVLKVLGIEDITVIEADLLVANSDTVIPRAQAAIDALELRHELARPVQETARAKKLQKQPYVPLPPLSDRGRSP